MRCVPQALYDEHYYTDNCDGFTESGDPGSRLLALLAHLDPDAKKVLDLGCGRGEVAKYLGERGCDVLSIDYSFAALNRFRVVNGDKRPFVQHDLSRGSPWLKDEYFDCVVIADLVEHVYHEQLIVVASDAVRVCRRGGTILVDTPIMDGGESDLHVDIKASVGEVHEYFVGTVLAGTHWYMKPEHCNIILRKV